MKRLCLAMVACVLAGAVTTSQSQTCGDPFDNVLCVYNIPLSSPTDIRGDGVESAFWADWSGKDYIEMIPPDDCYPGRCNFTGGESDAKINVKAAGNGRGLYVLSTVSDNTWVDRASADDWGADAIDFYFDALDANTVYTCTDCLIGLYDSKLSYTTQQFQVWMGATANPTGCRYGYYDNNMWSWTAGMYTWDVMESQYGMQVEVISKSATEKVQEWFFPWESYGQRNSIPVGTSLEMKRVAFSGGYNDKDGDNTDPDCLRWLGKDPWIGDANYWGDFELQAGMGTVLPVVSVKQSSHAPVSMNVARYAPSYYNLQGQKIAAGNLQSAAARAVLVNRSVGAKANVAVLGR